MSRTESRLSPHALRLFCSGRDDVPFGSLAYSFVQAPFFFDDFTQASTKATPSTPSSTVG